jgi:uncharacterized membrane protein HdeD (DUF308 family)
MFALSKHFRWTLAVRGIAAIVFGLLAWALPGITLMALLILFGAYALVDGGMALVGSLVHRKALRDWWLILLVAIASVLVGIATFLRPEITGLVLLFFIAARALVVGGLEIAAAIEYRHAIRHEWLLIVAGAVSVLFGLAVMAYPLEGALAVVWLIGTYAVLVGIAQLVFAIAARPAEIVIPAGPEPTIGLA